MSNDPLEQAKAHLDAGRLDEALAITTPLAASDDATHRALAMHSTALKGLGRRDEALGFDMRAVARFSSSGVAWHNLAATLGDLGRGRAAVKAMNEAFLRGVDGALSFERPSIKQSNETLFLQMADSAAIDRPTLVPISFRPTTPTGETP